MRIKAIVEADVIGATSVALLLLGLIAGFLWLFGLTGGRYMLPLVAGAAGLVVWGWWQLVKKTLNDVP
jgi:hypothetical protein